MSTLVTEKSGMIFRIYRYSKGFVHKTKQKRINKIVFPYRNKIYKQSTLNLKAELGMKVVPS